jgi:hypothetical protein
MTGTTDERSPQATKRLARLAGAAYVSLGVASLFGFFHAPLVTGDLDAIARIVSAPDLRFRVGVFGDVLSTVFAVPLALLLYELFNPVQRVLAALMALLLLVAIPITFVITLDYVGAHVLLSGAPEVSALTSAQREALASFFLVRHTRGVLAEEILWGLWLFPFGLLVIRSRFLPRVLGVLLIIAAVAYVAHSIISMLFGGHLSVVYERVTMLVRAAGEFPIMLWLLIKGARAPRASSEAA